MSDTCLDGLINKAFQPNFKANYLLCLPVQINNMQERIVIGKNDFAKYMVSVDSSFTDNEKLKEYVEEVIKGEKKFFFYEFVYKKLVDSSGYTLLFDKNKLTAFAKQDKMGFLKKYLLNYDSDKTYYNLDLTKSPDDFYMVVEILFKMNYLTAYSDGYIAVIKANCE